MNIKAILISIFITAWLSIPTVNAIITSDTPEETLQFKIQLYQLPEGWQLLCVYFRVQMQSPLCYKLHQSWYRPHKITINGLQPR